MGGSIAISEAVTPQIEYYSDRGGDYTIMTTEDKWTFLWGSIDKGVEVVVFRQEHLVAGHLMRNNVSNKSKQHFDAERDGYVDILIANETVEIKDVVLRCRGICASSVFHVIFATMRIYTREIKKPIRSGIVEISSEDAQTAYHCYKKAFKKNGFSTDVPEPPSKREQDYVVPFTRDVYQLPKLRY
tara:strand:- start:87 stop:644 length:558 start_codon:yes stop_codon:yes gene_type:complete